LHYFAGASCATRKHVFGVRSRLCSPQVAKKIGALREANPMMGFRGCRLGIIHPDITQMQVGQPPNGALRFLGRLTSASSAVLFSAVVLSAI
jgi:PEP-utilising enzyme, PEP-binding domain